MRQKFNISSLSDLEVTHQLLIESREVATSYKPEVEVVVLQ